MAFRIYPYNQGSKSARALAEALGGRVLKKQGSTWRARADDIVLNWGCVDMPIAPYARALVLNFPNRVRAASNKLLAFQAMKELEVPIPDFWTRKEEIPDDAFPIVCRTMLAGHSGAGIVMAATRADLVNAPLYVKYIKKQEEYRIHCGYRSIISVQRKARSRDVPDDRVNWQVRNHANGFVYVREGVVPPESVTRAALDALEAVTLDFGAVDVIWNNRERKAYVLEVNTAPGLEGQTVIDYANYFRNI